MAPTSTITSSQQKPHQRCPFMIPISAPKMKTLGRRIPCITHFTSWVSEDWGVCTRKKDLSKEEKPVFFVTQCPLSRLNVFYTTLIAFEWWEVAVMASAVACSSSRSDACLLALQFIRSATINNLLLKGSTDHLWRLVCTFFFFSFGYLHLRKY